MHTGELVCGRLSEQNPCSIRLPRPSVVARLRRLLPLQCYYLEVENVTCTDCSWGGSCAVQTMLTGPPPPTECLNQSQPLPNMDRPGGDFAASPCPSLEQCSQRCCDSAQCLAWVYVTALQGSFMDCTAGETCCFLKSAVPDPVPNNYPGGLWSGNVSRPPPGPVVVTPTGIRNAVPIGGLGAGTMEVRGDGTFHEITIQNASPGGAAKYPTQPDMMLSYRVNAGAGAPAARSIRSAPPAYAAPGVQQIVYAGTYPVSRLSVIDPSSLGANGLSADVYAYHHLVPNDSPTSATPAAVFTFTVTNNGNAAANVSFLMQLPFGAMRNCARVDYAPTSIVQQPSYAACMHSCGAGCGAWNFDSRSSNCTLLPSAGKMVYAQGTFCGLRGTWDSSDLTSLTLSMHPGDAASEAGPAVGDVSLRPVGSDGAQLSFAVGDDPSAIFTQFAANGAFMPGSNGGVTGGSFVGMTAAHGAVAVTSPSIAPGATVSVSIVFSWYFPNRDYYSSTVGQFYTNMFGSSSDVAVLYDNDHLVQVATDAAAHTSVFGGSGSTSLPPWLADHMVNQFSHFRNFIYAKDGSMREHEANDCPDLDSVHNDYQRHLPYLWAVPNFEEEKSRLYQQCQIQSGPDQGMITENPGFHAGEQCSGRRMGDVTSIWLLEVLELYRSTGNVTRLQEAWPAVVEGVNWSIRQCGDLGLPMHLVCTYDILAMEVYNTTTFNGVLHLAMMQAARTLALDPAINDTATAALALQAYNTGVTAMTTLMWNSTYGYFRAYYGGDAIMADCLYGQQVALAHGLGWLLPQSMISSHLQAELKYNGNDYGLTVVTGRHTLPPEEIEEQEQLVLAGVVGRGMDEVAERKTRIAADKRELMRRIRDKNDGQDDAVWMGGAPTWSCLAVQLGSAGPTGTNITAALEPTRWELENYRSRLHSMWDLTGLSTTGDWGSDAANGQPFCTSHYGFMLPDYYLIYALSGQQLDIPHGTLSFAPLYSCPFALPFASAGREGSISCDAAGTYTLALAYGELSLPAGGLSVSGKAYSGAVDLQGGQSVSW
jgi:non-lysosomal glucosylceramidase